MARVAKTNKFTDIELKKLTSEKDSQIGTLLHDGAGLYLRRLKSGWFWQLRIKSPETQQNQWYSLFGSGPYCGYPHKKISEARASARELSALAEKGVDSRALEERNKEAAEKERAAQQVLAAVEESRLTVRLLFDQFQLTELTSRDLGNGNRQGRKDNGAEFRASFERRVFPYLGEKKADEVTQADIVSILDRVKNENKQRTSAVIFSNLQQLFRFAVVREIVPRSPMAALSNSRITGKKVRRKRFLDESELTSLIHRLPQAGLSRRTEIAFWIILSTGCRVDELCNAEWRFIDFEKSTWYLPTTKNGRDHLIHLSAFALKHFQELFKMSARFRSIPWVYFSRNTLEPLNSQTFTKQFRDRQRNEGEALKNRTSCSDALTLEKDKWTSHDLRRTAATYMAKLRFSRDVINEALNHITDDEMSDVYIQDRRLAEQKLAFDALGEKLELIIANATQSNVRLLRA